MPRKNTSEICVILVCKGKGKGFWLCKGKGKGKGDASFGPAELYAVGPSERDALVGEGKGKGDSCMEEDAYPDTSLPVPPPDRCATASGSGDPAFEIVFTEVPDDLAPPLKRRMLSLVQKPQIQKYEQERWHQELTLIKEKYNLPHVSTVLNICRSVGEANMYRLVRNEEAEIPGVGRLLLTDLPGTGGCTKTVDGKEVVFPGAKGVVFQLDPEFDAVIQLAQWCWALTPSASR